jgi:WD40 repeat protein
VARIFISHASEDGAIAGELHRWLVTAGHDVFLDQDPRDGITVGEEWEQRLYEKLRWADAVLCLVTSSFRNSAWCTAELAIARSAGSRVLPLQAEFGVSHPLLSPSRYQYTSLIDSPAAARASVTEALRRIDASGGLGWPDGRSPFPGLQPFDTDLRRVFFGRRAEAEALASLLRPLSVPAERGIVMVVGPSGSGKSSLVRAGLLPLLADEAGWETVPPVLPGGNPVAALSRELAHAARQLGLAWTVERVHGLLEADDGLTMVVNELLLAAPQHARRLLVVVDQFEELLTVADAGNRRRFAGLLGSAMTGPLQVVATLRPEFLGQLLASPELADLPTRPFPLRPLRREALLTVIEGPARVAGINVHPELMSRLVADTEGGEGLPLLAFTLAQLAEGVGRGGELSAAQYDRLGGVHGALISQADAALADAVRVSGRRPEQVIASLLLLVAVDDMGHPIRWRVEREVLSEQVAQELDCFVTRRLLTTDTEGDKVVLGVAHEAFLSAWPPLDRAIKASAVALRARRAVEQAAEEWQQANRPSTRLWERGQLAAAVTDLGTGDAGSRSVDRVAGDRVGLSPRAGEFLRLSVRRDRGRRRRAVIVLSALLVMAVAAAGVAVVLQRIAEQRQQIATARQLLAQAESSREADPRTALLLGIAADHFHSDGTTRSGLVRTLSTNRYAGTLTGHGDAVDSVSFSPDGRILASGATGEPAMLWEIADGSRPPQQGRRLPDGAGYPVAFAPRGRTLATVDDDDRVILWDVTTPDEPVRLGASATSDAGWLTLSFTRDGNTLAAAGADTVTLFDVSDRSRPTPIGRVPGVRDPVTFAPDGTILATGTANGAVVLWAVSDPRRPSRLGVVATGYTNMAGGIAFSPDGKTLATSEYFEGEVTLWEVSDRLGPTRVGEPLVGHTDTVHALAFSPDGQRLASGSSDQTAMLWDVSDLQEPSRLEVLKVHTELVGSLAFAPDGRTLVTGSADRTVILWDLWGRGRPTRVGEPLSAAAPGDKFTSVDALALASESETLAIATTATSESPKGKDKHLLILLNLSDRRHPVRVAAPLSGHANKVLAAAFTPDGRILATSSSEKTILWNLTDAAQPARLAELPGNSISLAFAPDGQTLATGDADKNTYLWNVSDGARPRRLGQPLSGHSEEVTAVAFSTDGKTLGTGSTDLAVILWDVSDPSRATRLGQSLTGYTNVVSALAFASDARTLAAADANGKVILWDVSEPGNAFQLGRPLETQSFVFFNPATFIPGRAALLTAGNNSKETLLWDVSDPIRPLSLWRMSGHRVFASALAISGDADTLVIGDLEGRVIVWDLTDFNALHDHALRRACDLTGRGLNPEEWVRYLQGVPYRETCSK